MVFPLGATNSASGGSLNVRAVAGWLSGIMVSGAGNTPTLRVVDTASGTVTGGTDIISEFTPVAGATYGFTTPIKFDNGLYIWSTGSVGLTVCYF